MSAPQPVRVAGQLLDWQRPLVMGVLNLTPDSFSDGGTYPSLDAVEQRARALVADGAEILDLGGESTRPGAAKVDAATELDRVLPAVQRLARARLPALLSVDTSKAMVADAALTHGASIVNDVTALADPHMAQVVARHGSAVILMHMRGEPRTMQQGHIHYDDVVAEVSASLHAACERAVAAGIERAKVWLDPGIGFGKELPHNLALTRHLCTIAEIGQPVVYGPSRKRFLGQLTGRDVDARDPATAAACVAAILYGAHVLRVHDAHAVRDAVAVATALRNTP